MEKQIEFTQAMLLHLMDDVAGGFNDIANCLRIQKKFNRRHGWLFTIGFTGLYLVASDISETKKRVASLEEKIKELSDKEE